MAVCTVTTSWDDGHKEDIRLAQMLATHGIKGTFYVSPHDREFSADEHLSREEICALATEFEIGAHTMTHPLLTKLPSDAARAEIVDSKLYLEELLGRAITSFCYPSGDENETITRLVERAGFTYARTVERFHYEIPQKPLHAGTTIHAYDHWLDALSIFIFAKGNPFRFATYFLHWDELAIAQFEYVRARGGVFHLWGHSWEIAKHGHYGKLERVLAHISGHDDVTYVSNGELV